MVSNVSLDQLGAVAKLASHNLWVGCFHQGLLISPAPNLVLVSSLSFKFEEVKKVFIKTLILLQVLKRGRRSWAWWTRRSRSNIGWRTSHRFSAGLIMLSKFFNVTMKMIGFCIFTAWKKCEAKVGKTKIASYVRSINFQIIHFRGNFKNHFLFIYILFTLITFYCTNPHKY